MTIQAYLTTVVDHASTLAHDKPLFPPDQCPKEFRDWLQRMAIRLANEIPDLPQAQAQATTQVIGIALLLSLHLAYKAIVSGNENKSIQ